jgi:hypothetical protein
VRAEIDGLGAQIVRIAAPGAPQPDPCAAPEPAGNVDESPLDRPF